MNKKQSETEYGNRYLVGHVTHVSTRLSLALYSFSGWRSIFQERTSPLDQNLLEVSCEPASS